MLFIVRNTRVTRLRRGSYRFQDILDMLDGSSPVCQPRIFCVDNVGNLDGDASVSRKVS